MFFDSQAWPPAAGGDDPPPDPRPLSAAQERVVMRIVGALLVALFVGPFAGSSVIDAVVALWR